MTAAEFVAQVSLKATGKLPTFTSGSKKWLKILAIGNQYLDVWAREDDWNSLYTLVNNGSVSATDTFDLNQDIRKISMQEGDFVRVTSNGSSTYSDYTIVPVDRLKEYNSGNYVARVGNSLKFNAPFLASSQYIGGSIIVPGYLSPEHMVNDGDDVPCDDPMWLVFMTAAEYVRTDITLQSQYPNLVAEANDLMQKMKEDNAGQANTPYMGWQPLGQSWS